MPIYEYICLKCRGNFSLLQSLYPADKTIECPKCASNEVKKVISSFSYASGAKGSSPSVSAPNFGGGGG